MDSGEVTALIPKLSVVIAKHTYVTGSVEDSLKDFLNEHKVGRLAYISHPFSYASPLNSTLTLYEKGVEVSQSKGPAMKGPDLLFYAKDFLTTFMFMGKMRMKFDLYVGADNLNASAGLVLRRLGLVRRVIFYTIDYVPKRFENTLLNRVYHLNDRFCCYHCDCVWNLSPLMAEAREKRGVLRERSAPQITVPTGANFDGIARLPFDQINRHTIVHMGHLRKNQGVDLLISAFPRILHRHPKARLIIIGTGPLERELRALCSRLSMDEYVRFTGMIEDHAEMERLLSTCAVGVAPYVPDPEFFTQFADPGKPKVYMAAGLPVVITKVPQIAYEIDRENAGIAIDYDENQLVDAVVSLLTDDDLYKKCRENAVRLASRYRWGTIFEKALGESLEAKKGLAFA
jgi:glycosyltransferase involved in cell wall biosynthesis